MNIAWLRRLLASFFALTLVLGASACSDDDDADDSEDTEETDTGADEGTDDVDETTTTVAP